MTKQTWTTERTEILINMWMKGKSGAEIAKELGNGITRNAVIGKAHRLELPDHGLNHSESRIAMAQQQARNKPGRWPTRAHNHFKNMWESREPTKVIIDVLKGYGITTDGNQLYARAAIHGLKYRDGTDRLFQDESVGKPFADLEPNECHYPVKHGWCGKKGYPWCEFHCKIVLVKDRKKPTAAKDRPMKEIMDDLDGVAAK
jgi:GcrA cell cycle regulator